MSVQIVAAPTARVITQARQRNTPITPLARLTALSWRSERMKRNNVMPRVRRALRRAIVAALMALAAPSAFAQTTGQIIGTVVDAQGGVLPGVTVTATSPQL